MDLKSIQCGFESHYEYQKKWKWVVGWMVKPVDCKSTICESDISVQVWGNPPYKTECVGKWIFLARLERGACGFESRHSDQLEVRQSRRVAAVCKTVPYRIVSSNLTTSTKYNKNGEGINWELTLPWKQKVV